MINVSICQLAHWHIDHISTLIIRLRILNHLFAGIHIYLYASVLVGRQTFIVFVVSHAFHFLELGRRYTAILQIVFYSIGAVLGTFMLAS